MAGFGRTQVLLVAPVTPDLPELRHVDAEVAAVEAAFARGALALRGNVTKEQVLRVLAHGWNIIWWAGHGTQQGLVLSDGLLPIDEALQLMRQANPGLLVLNTCESAILGMYLHHELGCPVVCTIGPQSDAVAYITGRLLAQNLADGYDIPTAFMRSKPGELMQAQNYRLFADSQENRGSESNDDLRTIRLINDLGRKLEQRMVELENTVTRRLDEQDKRLGHIEQIVMLLSAPSPVKRWSFGVAWVLLLAPMVGVFSGFRDYVGLTWQIGYVWLVLSWLASALFFAYGLGMIRDAWQQITRLGALLLVVMGGS